MASSTRLTSERLRELLSYDPLTGLFTWRVSRGGTARSGAIAGSVHTLKDGYRRVQIKIDLTLYLAHRLAWLYMTGDWPPHEVDHVDTDSTNNSWNNLRVATRVVNAQNRRRPAVSKKIQVIGVYARKNRFIARLCINGRGTYIGCFRTIDEASAAYKSAKRLHHEGCTI